MRANLLPVPTLIQTLVSYSVGIFLITSLLALTMAACKREPPPRKKDIFQFSLKTTECITRAIFTRQLRRGGGNSTHLALRAVLSKVIGNYCFQSPVFTAFQMPEYTSYSINKGLHRN